MLHLCTALQLCPSNGVVHAHLCEEKKLKQYGAFLGSYFWKLEAPGMVESRPRHRAPVRGGAYASPPVSSGTPGVFYTYFYNHARRLRLEKLGFLL